MVVQGRRKPVRQNKQIKLLTLYLLYFVAIISLSQFGQLHPDLRSMHGLQLQQNKIEKQKRKTQTHTHKDSNQNLKHCGLRTFGVLVEQYQYNSNIATSTSTIATFCILSRPNNLICGSIVWLGKSKPNSENATNSSSN